jgi:hypothetical protein
METAGLFLIFIFGMVRFIGDIKKETRKEDIDRDRRQ